MEIAPFYVGQEIVAIRDHSQGAFKKGDEFVVNSIEKGCCNWLVTVGIRATTSTWRCIYCNSIYQSGIEWKFNTIMFSPKIEISQFISMKQLAEQ